MGTRFWRLFYAYVINTVGDEFFLLALPLVLLNLGYPSSVVTFVFGMMTFATVLGGLTLGYLVDRFPVDAVISCSYYASAAVLLLSAAAIAEGLDTTLVILFAAAILGVFAAISSAAVDAGIPKVVKRPAQVTRGYSLVESARTTAAFVGPAMAGVVARLHNLAIVLVVNSVSFGISAAMIWRKPRRRQPAADRPPSSGRWLEVLSGVRLVFRQRALHWGIGLSFIGNITLLGAAQPMFLIRLVRDFRLSSYTASAMIIAAGLVGVLAVQVMVRLQIKGEPFAVMLGASAIIGVSGLIIGAVNNWAVSGAAYCVIATAAIAYTVYWRTFRQQIVSQGELGRVSSTCRSLAYIGLAAGAFIAGALQSAGLSVATLFVLGGGAYCLSTALVFGLGRATIRAHTSK